MADHFGISQLVDYLTRMGLQLADVDQEQEKIELAFHGNQGRWRLIIGLQQKGAVRRLLLMVPQYCSIKNSSTI